MNEWVNEMLTTLHNSTKVYISLYLITVHEKEYIPSFLKWKKHTHTHTQCCGVQGLKYTNFQNLMIQFP